MIAALPPADTHRLLALLIGDHGRIRTITFAEGQRQFSAEVQEDNLWGAVKDNLLLAEYERAGIRLVDQRGVVVDAGAHVGLFTLLASAHARVVWAYEADPRNFALLSANIARNRARNVIAQQHALWSTDGHVDFVEGVQTGSGSIVGQQGRRFAVRAESLDSVVAATGPIDLLKLDIEGAEFDVLDHASDATLRAISAVAAELHLEGRRERLSPTIGRLRDKGFSVVVRQPPVAHWRETIGTLTRNRRSLRRAARLRLTVAAVYGLVALSRPLLDLRSRLDMGGELAFLYARRRLAA